MADKLKVQGFRANDLSHDLGKQVEFGRVWCEDFFGINRSALTHTVTLQYKPLSVDQIELAGRTIELVFGEVTKRGDRKAYANDPSGFSQIKSFFINDLHLTEANLNDYFAIYKTTLNEYFLYYVPKMLYDNFINLFRDIDVSGPVAHKTVSSLTPLDQPLQQIFYGAPGTGKSHTINRETKGRMTFRTTFHPDSDYSTFVGAYKPTMVSEIRYGLNGSNAVPYRVGGKDLMENRIEYRFVKQAFMKAYIAAWREFTQLGLAAPSMMMTPPSQSNQVRLSSDRNQGEVWIVKKVEDDKVNYSKEYVISKVDNFEKEVKDYWQKLSTSDNVTLKTNEHLRAAVCDWYSSKYGTSGTADDCWNAAWEELQGGKSIMGGTLGQTYSYSLENETIVVFTSRNASKGTIAKCFNSNVPATSAEKSVAKKLRDYGVEDFDTAWEKLKEEVNKGELTLAPTQTESVNTIAPVFLIIEEINRGNCAQIFGDLFQLLDRKEGFSQYPIHADEDVRKCLVSEHTDEDPSFGIDGLDFSPEQASYINGVLDCEDDVAAKIARGEVLVLPPNLYIWATMNTSDQSLFPIDSAFKRRWEWKYVKITDAKKNWSIKGNGYSCDWWTFVQEMNKKIASATRSDDKKLGYFFCKPEQDNTFIDENKFVGKVIFYLWNDVFKDNDYSIFKVNASSGEPTFDDFYMEGEDGKIVPDSSSVKQFLINVVGQENMTIADNAPQDQEHEQQSSTLSIEE